MLVALHAVDGRSDPGGIVSGPATLQYNSPCTLGHLDRFQEKAGQLLLGHTAKGRRAPVREQPQWLTVGDRANIGHLADGLPNLLGQRLSPVENDLLLV